MIVESVRVVNFLSHVDSLVDFTDAPLWLIHGDNGSGKSALFDAVEYALYGEHRGGSQGAHLLVKQGANRGSIEVVVRLNGQRYRICRFLDANPRRGNLGGEIALWDSEGKCWNPQNVGDGVRAVWGWLEPRLPSHQLFRSAIFLRQGATDFFLRGSSSDRVKRFGDLIDLSPYSRLCSIAQAHSGKAKTSEHKAQGKLAGLGDVSDETMAAMQACLTKGEENLSRAKLDTETAELVARDAEEWQRLASEQMSLQQSRADVEKLLADETSILDDARRVSQWDRASTRFSDYWQQRDRADARHADAVRAKSDAEKAGENAHTVEAEIEEHKARLLVIQDDEAPRTERLRDEARREAMALTLEAQISATRLAVERAAIEIEKYAYADEQLAVWRKREAALPRLQAAAVGRVALESKTTDLKKARQDLTQAEGSVSEAKGALEQAEHDLESAAGIEAATSADVNLLAEESAHLQGRLQSHGHLTGTETECPTCAQPLTEDAHAHVRDVLGGEQAALRELKTKHKAAQSALREAQASLKASRVLHKAALDLSNERRTALALATRAVTEKERDLNEARATLAEALDRIRIADPQYAGYLDQITTDWVAEEKGAIQIGIATVEPDVAALSRARKDKTTASIQLDTLRGQRADALEVRGERLPPDDLVATAGTCEKHANTLDAQITELQQETTGINVHLQKLSGVAAAYAKQMESAQEAEAAALTEEVNAGRAAEELFHQLRSEWELLLASRDAFEAEREDIERRRSNAERTQELHAARGQLEQVDRQLRANSSARDQIHPAHRIPADTSREALRQARKNEIRLASEKSHVEGKVDDLIQRRGQAEEFRQEIDLCARESMTFADLAELLKDGGVLQAQVVDGEQRRIAAEVNAVLDLLGDSLRVQLGGARRGSLQDIHILDTSDPIGAPRFFEFLSGGEQFRVALALALALHRRVSKDRAGTIIVDEGFGALDGDRRDALARQMADASQGVLGLKLAESIIICSHSSEVQRHFPYRWSVVKDQGTATVSRPEVDDEWGRAR